MYEIIDNDNTLIASAENAHDADKAWDVLTKSDEELSKIYDEGFLKKLIAQYRPEWLKPGTIQLRLVQIHRKT